MANSKTNSKEKKKGLKQEVIGIVLLAISLFLIIALLSYSEANIASNWGGVVGGYTAWLLFKAVGYSAYIFPILIVILALEFLIRREFDFRPLIPVSLFFLLVSLSGLLSSLVGSELMSGGVVGKYLCLFLWDYLNWTGALIFLLAIFIASGIFATGISVVGILSKGYGIYKQRTEAGSLKPEDTEDEEAQEEDKAKENPPAIIQQPSAEKKLERPAIIVPPAPKKQPKQKEPTQEHFEFLKATGEFQLPPISFLDSPPEKAHVLDEEALRTNSKILEKKLKDYGIDGQVIAVTPGPVVNMYEFEPAPGVKVASIVNLSDDLALAMRAASIRIIAPIPGKAVVGIEVPNAAKQKIYLREILESQAYTKSHSKLTFALGKDISGNPFAADLTKMPHLLMAGATGAGKSVTVNDIIISILYKATPNDVRFLMIDPKMLELSAYEGIPHLLTPVVTEPKRAASVLRGIVNEMGERYKLMAEKGTKSIDKYNQLFDEEGSKDEDKENHRRLPFIVVVIDELADLMMVAGKDVEESLVRLSQMARAAGIHILVATQRPSVDVITGLIKANLPARISLQVASRTDSRTILDTGGAETLIGEGDMLFLPPGSSRVRRIHGAYISEAEIKRVTDFLKKQGKPAYDKAIAEAKAEEKGGAADEEFDEEFNQRYDEAVAIVVELQQASTSYIQRRLRIGYNTAARIIEKMEAEGIVGPAQGSRAREVLVKKEGGAIE